MRFKPGDKAKIVGNTNGHGFEIGQEVEVGLLEQSLYRDIYKVGKYFVADCDLEPLEASPVQEEESFDQWYSRLIEWQSTHFKETTTKYEDFRWIEENVISNLRKELEELKKQKI